MNIDLVEDLRREIAAGRVTCIIGAGVSIAASFTPDRTPNVASWVGLLEDGIARCTAVVPSLPTPWPERMLGMLDLGKAGDGEALLSVAEQITVKLGGASGGELKRWLRETVGALSVRHPEVPLALARLGVPLLTTNYDEILEEATGLRALDWRDAADTERVLRGEDRAIVHVHGHWRRSENLVLGVRSYENIVSSQHAQAVLRSLRMMKTLLFVGFGAGLDDPNFGAMLRWSREVFASSEVRHYRLALAAEKENVQAQHPPEERIFVLSYGEKHSDLAPFLARLAPGHRPPNATYVPPAAGPDESAVTPGAVGTAPAPGAAAGQAPTRASLRKLLGKVLLGASQFDAFCADHFPNVHRQFSSGMVRDDKETLLVERHEAAEILDKLRQDHADATAKHEGLLAYV